MSGDMSRTLRLEQMKKQAEQKATNLKAEASSRALVSCEFTSHKHFFLCRAKS